VIKPAGQEPIPVALTLFNGGVRGSVTTLFIQSSVSLATPVPILASVKLGRISEGRYGLRATAKIPQISEGHGSVLDFRVSVERLFRSKGMNQSYVAAKCRDGRLDARMDAGLSNGVRLSSAMIQPCSSKGS